MTIQLTLPDDLAERAQRAGLLSEERVASLLQAELDRKKDLNDFFAKLDAMHTADATPAMSLEEITEEVRQVRAESRLRKTA